ncbi:MAG TPA: hypothetical protein VH278_08070 [Burkholderiaceae bacterium]|nr:hypothetical protein [Burkholderiaceae bacterium]
MPVHYGRGAAEANAVVAEICQAGGKADAVAADMAGRDGPLQLARHVCKVIGSRLDILRRPMRC